MQPFKGRGPRRTGSPRKAVKPPSLALLKKDVLLLPKASSSHSGPTVILWDEGRCYTHLPKEEAEGAKSILLQVMKAGLEVRVQSTFLETKLCPSSALTSGDLKVSQGRVCCLDTSLNAIYVQSLAFLGL